jgi:hypothetical protein
MTTRDSEAKCVLPDVGQQPQQARSQRKPSAFFEYYESGELETLGPARESGRLVKEHPARRRAR